MTLLSHEVCHLAPQLAPPQSVQLLVHSCSKVKRAEAQAQSCGSKAETTRDVASVYRVEKECRAEDEGQSTSLARARENDEGEKDDGLARMERRGCSQSLRAAKARQGRGQDDADQKVVRVLRVETRGQGQNRREAQACQGHRKNEEDQVRHSLPRMAREGQGYGRGEAQARQSGREDEALEDGRSASRLENGRRRASESEAKASKELGSRKASGLSPPSCDLEKHIGDHSSRDFKQSQAQVAHGEDEA